MGVRVLDPWIVFSRIAGFVQFLARLGREYSRLSRGCPDPDMGIKSQARISRVESNVLVCLCSFLVIKIICRGSMHTTCVNGAFVFRQPSPEELKLISKKVRESARTKSYSFGSLARTWLLS
jgi:hypothetical protein